MNINSLLSEHLAFEIRNPMSILCLSLWDHVGMHKGRSCFVAVNKLSYEFQNSCQLRLVVVTPNRFAHNYKVLVFEANVCILKPILFNMLSNPTIYSYILHTYCIIICEFIMEF